MGRSDHTVETYKKNYLDHRSDMNLALSKIRGRKVVIQAGGHCGTWAHYLAGLFDTVYTFEPHQVNFACLTRNAALPNVFASRGVLGNERGPLRLWHNSKYTGGHHAEKHAGDVPVYRIDDLNLPACDFLMLDVEGMEYPALCGAAETIKKFRPVIQIEAQGHGEKYGWGSLVQIKEFLKGYKEIGQIALDRVFCAQ